MIAPGNALIQVIFGIAFMVATGYALGRIHQWYRDGARREQAYRNGYDLASDSMFKMAMNRRSTAGPVHAEPKVAVHLPDDAAEGPSGKRGVGTSRRRIVARQSEFVAQSRTAY